MLSRDDVIDTKIEKIVQELKYKLSSEDERILEKHLRRLYDVAHNDGWQNAYREARAEFERTDIDI